MKLHVDVHNQAVATLESTDGFRHVMTYHPVVPPEQFVSLLMPVRTESYAYPELHPLFRINLPEGFLLSIPQEQLGPHVSASPLNLLSVVGRNAIGRVKVVTPGADPTQPPVPFDLNGILRGDNSEDAFVDLVRRHAASGVSGVVPKFLSPNTFGEHTKGTLATERQIIKGTTDRLPGVTLNEHLCMEVSRQAGFPTRVPPRLGPCPDAGAVRCPRASACQARRQEPRRLTADGLERDSGHGPQRPPGLLNPARPAVAAMPEQDCDTPVAMHAQTSHPESRRQYML